ncbi:hypothetical protein [Portibacter lacus]|uniref:Septum formation inhibitor Maf n=1 Tax=Portibacter lacus TaxID=1099794 RepID=A0AA37WF10_9BACT|nr:hypothetical protein [Portibacter lacus]GLR18042.1 hypothetical protein GCM10007940_26570 [Portibacter lacus]
MKYLIVAAVCLLGIIAISLRDNGLAEFSEMQTEIVPESLDQTQKTKVKDNPRFNEYWYAGLAELSGYDLKQSRYGEIHNGQATMIFVTEPFSRKKQVKLDNPGAAGNDKTSVLKLNSTRTFLTGIYPYSMMTSVFNPVSTASYTDALKLTLSGQEWCGHVFMQMNLDGRQYDVKGYSYFESEGDQNFSIKSTYLEDELFNLIRLNPELLPKGEFELIPSAVVSRFMHEEVKPYKAMSRLEKTTWKEKQVSQYTIHYEHNNRVVNIYFQSDFPYLIEGWDDTYQSFNREVLTSEAVRKNTKILDYWNKHDVKDAYLHKELYQ